jgi:hypothetical protein
MKKRRQVCSQLDRIKLLNQNYQGGQQTMSEKIVELNEGAIKKE